MDINSIILAGGKSKRLGRNKLLESIGQTSLLERVILNLSSFDNKIILVTAHDSALPDLSRFNKIEIVEDLIPGKGTLGGIYTGLNTSDTVMNYIVACDMPFINVKLLKHMSKYAYECDAVVPRVKEVLEPLHAIYSKNCLNSIRYLIDGNRLSVLDLYPMIKVKYIQEDEIENLDRNYLSFFNINTEADLISGRELANRREIVDDQC